MLAGTPSTVLPAKVFLQLFLALFLFNLVSGPTMGHMGFAMWLAPNLRAVMLPMCCYASYVGI